MNNQGQTEESAAVAEGTKFREVRFEYSPQFPRILEHCQASLLVSTYQAGKLGVISSHQGKLQLAFHSFEQSMGVAASPQRIAVGTRGQVWFLQAAHDLGPRIEPPNTHDGCFLARSSLVTGNIHIHDLAWGQSELWVVNTLFSCLSTLSEDFSFVPRWRPKFVSQLAAEDRCHLNGMAMRNGRPKFVTALSNTDAPAGWRPNKATTGLIIDVDSGEVVASGLSMPHSPRLYNDRLWVLDSGKGNVSQVDESSGKLTVIAEVPGYTRGLAFSGQFAFVGLSRIRESNIFGGLPIASKHAQLHCGVGIVDLVSGQSVAALQFHSGVEEIYDVQVLAGFRFPVLSGPQPQEDSAQTIWLVPREDQAARMTQQNSVWLRSPGPEGPARPAMQMMQSEDPQQLVRRGASLHERGQPAQAIECYKAALAAQPDYADAYNNMGNALQDLDRRDDAIECYRAAIRVQPKYVFSYRNLGYVLKEEGRLDEGMEVLRQAQAIEPNPVIRLVMDTSLPPVYPSVEDVRVRRTRLLDNVQRMVDEGLSIDVTNTSAPTMFYAAYQGENDRQLQVNLCKLFRAPQPFDPRRKRRSGDKIRVGFISRHFRNHTIGRLNLGIVEKLPRDRFDVTVISVGRYDDMLAARFKAGADHHLELPTNLQAIRQQVAALDLDILMFSDIGMDTLTYTLAMSRMAPIQCATWGHPVTTGSPAVDYFISSKTLEVPEADEHYSERLERFDVLNVYYYRPDPPVKKRRSDFGLSEDKNLYLCFQNVFKFHPDFDPILRGILERDPKAEIVFMEGKHGTWTNLLRQRWSRTLGRELDKVRFLPGQSHPDFMSLYGVSDVSLDPIHFGGGNTTYEALAVGLPVVTLPSRFLRCRISAAQYEQIGVRDFVVDSPDAYIELAHKLGTDADYRRFAQEKILSACAVLFEDRRAVAEYARFFEAALARHSVS
jgi:uncharacterized protein (TIGR03032 family)